LQVGALAEIVKIAMPPASTAGTAPPEPGLPHNYISLRAVLDEKVSPGSFVNTMGLVKDCRLPVPTGGTGKPKPPTAQRCQLAPSNTQPDHKSTLALYDLSTEDETNGISLIIFRPEADMPKVNVGDVVVLNAVKVQRYRGDPLSLITNHRTSIMVYSASKIPRPPESAKDALVPPRSRDRHKPGTEEHAYVSFLFHKIDKYSLPTEQEFDHKATQSMNIKGKFSLLKDVQDAKFYDLVVQVAREPYASGFDFVVLYVSDYTENPRFYPQVWSGLPEATSGSGDPYGYTSESAGMPKTDWVGPYGKMSLQITCFEPHATYIRDEVKAGDWVSLRNVQVKYGSNDKFLEGVLRGERNVVHTRVNVHVLEIGDRETIDPNLKEAIRRWRDYLGKKKQQIKALKSAQVAGQKRKASAATEQPEKPLNSKARRKQKRAAKDQRGMEKQANEQLGLGLNEQVTSEAHKEAPLSTLEAILKPPIMNTTSTGDRTTSYVLPFSCTKYQARARVVDFFPSSLEDFAASHKRNVFEEVLSEDEGESDSAASSSDGDAPGTAPVWEWRFALQLEDPAPPTATGKKPAQRPRLWVFVNNSEAQCLTGLDATDLRQDAATLTQLRERMFTLWGNLEEHKARSAEQARKRKAKEKGARQRGPRIEKPSLSSDAEDEGQAEGVEPVSNKPFACCIREYGVYEKGEGEEEEGRWVRCFGLFGTKICS
jgi:hypothetical protein